MKYSRRSLRRHHRARIRKRVKWIMREMWGYQADDMSPRFLGRYTTTRTPCSCRMCGNPRRYFGERTFHEVRHSSNDDDRDYFE